MRILGAEMESGEWQESLVEALRASVYGPYDAEVTKRARQLLKRWDGCHDTANAAIEELKERLPERVEKYWDFMGYREHVGMGREAVPGIVAHRRHHAAIAIAVLQQRPDYGLDAVVDIMEAAILKWAEADEVA